MKLNKLEKFVIKEFLRSRNLNPEKPGLNLDAIEIEGRGYSPMGFITDLKTYRGLELLPNQETFTGGSVVVKINDEIDTEYVLYIKNGILDAIEGFTYDNGPWPRKIKTYRFMSEAKIQVINLSEKQNE